MNVKRTLFTAGLILGLAIIAIRFVGKSSSNEGPLLKAKVKKGTFEDIVMASGELRAENNVDIQIPQELMSGKVRLYDIKITDMIEEGQLVDSGDYVASLDHSAVMERIEKEEESLLEHYQNFENAKMDTNLNLTNARNNLMTDEDQVEEKRIILEQSIYESPSVQRQAQMSLDRAKRRLEQNIRSYQLNVKKSKQRMLQIHGYIKRSKEQLKEYRAIFESLNIKAPKKGLFIYARDRYGNKLSVGTMVSRYHPKIAELPDLSSLISRTYVNEVDISKIEVGQSVHVGIDAFPEKSFEGEVITVSNIGQSINDKTKVFEVDIRLFEADTLLKPAMTTNNAIKTKALKNALFLPSDAVFMNDSLNYVFPVKRKEKRVVRLGAQNENFTVILDGLNKGEKVLMLPPENAENLPWGNLEVIKTMAEMTNEGKPQVSKAKIQ